MNFVVYNLDLNKDIKKKTKNKTQNECSDNIAGQEQRWLINPGAPDWFVFRFSKAAYLQDTGATSEQISHQSQSRPLSKSSALT